MEDTTKLFEDEHKQVDLLKYLQQKLTRTPRNSTGTVKDLILKAGLSDKIKQMIRYLPGLIIWLRLSKQERRSSTDPDVQAVQETVRSKWTRYQPAILEYAIAFLVNETNANVNLFFDTKPVSAQGTNRGIVLKGGQIYVIEQWEKSRTNRNKGINLFNTTNRLEDVDPAPASILHLKSIIFVRNIPDIPAPMDAGDGGGGRDTMQSPGPIDPQLLQLTPTNSAGDVSGVSSLDSVSPGVQEMVDTMLEMDIDIDALLRQSPAVRGAAASAGGAEPHGAAASSSAAASREAAAYSGGVLLDVVNGSNIQPDAINVPLALTVLEEDEVRALVQFPESGLTF